VDDRFVVTEYIHLPINGILNIRNLYRIPSIISIAVFMAKNSEPKVDASTVFWRFEYRRIGARLTKINTPVCERRVTHHLAWLA
jgi:hypothetical protein